VKLPRIAPRKEEIKEISALLEDASFDSADKMSRAIVAKTYEMLLQREWYVIAWQPDNEPPTFMYGFYGTSAAAQKALTDPAKLGLSGGRAQVMKVQSFMGRMEYVTDVVDAPALTSTVCKCGHQQGGHDIPKTRGACIANDCDCRAFVKG
jgi:hypothetical protein